MRKIIHVLVVVVLLTIVPVTLLAQDDLTLEGLVGIVEDIEGRLSDIEAMFADPWSPEVIYTDDGICQSPLHTDGSSGWVNLIDSQVHQETADAYRMKYGVSLSPTDVYLTSISFSVSSSEVYLQYSKGDETVFETWANCEFLGHSEWARR